MKGKYTTNQAFRNSFYTLVKTIAAHYQYLAFLLNYPYRLQKLESSHQTGPDQLVA